MRGAFLINCITEITNKRSLSWAYGKIGTLQGDSTATSTTAHITTTTTNRTTAAATQLGALRRALLDPLTFDAEVDALREQIAEDSRLKPEDGPLTYLPTLPTYLPTYPPSRRATYFASYSCTFLLGYLLTLLHTSLVTYSLSYLPTYLPSVKKTTQDTY